MKEFDKWLKTAVKRNDQRTVRLLWWLNDIEFGLLKCPARRFFVSDMLSSWKQTEEVVRVRGRFGL